MNNLEDYTVEQREQAYKDLQKLHTMPEFQRLILDGYFREQAVVGVSNLANDSVKRAGLRPDIMETLIGISQLQQYFIQVASLAPVDSEEDEEDGEQQDPGF